MFKFALHYTGAKKLIRGWLRPRPTYYLRDGLPPCFTGNARFDGQADIQKLPQISMTKCLLPLHFLKQSSVCLQSNLICKPTLTGIKEDTVFIILIWNMKKLTPKIVNDASHLVINSGEKSQCYIMSGSITLHKESFCSTVDLRLHFWCSLFFYLLIYLLLTLGLCFLIKYYKWVQLIKQN